jgi:hypothetical protein
MDNSMTFALTVFALPVSALAQELFQTQDAAQQHCPSDTVVWLNTRSDIYHFQGERYYGNTEREAYVCEAEADASGDRATENGE